MLIQKTVCAGIDRKDKEGHDIYEFDYVKVPGYGVYEVIYDQFGFFLKRVVYTPEEVNFLEISNIEAYCVIGNSIDQKYVEEMED